MKTIRLLSILSLFCILSVCAGRGFLFSASQPDLVSQPASQLQQSIHNSSTLQDSAAGYIRLVRTCSFTAASTLTNVAEHRIPTQSLNVRGAKLNGAARGAYNLKYKWRCNLCTGGLKMSTSGVPYILQQYHKTVSSLWCSTFSKCYIVALCKILC